MTDAPMGAPPSEAGAREDLFMAGAIVKMAQLALKWAPRAMAALDGLDRLNKRFPDAPGKGAAYARQVGARLAEGRLKRSDGWRLRHTLTIVREAIGSMELDRAGDVQFATQAAAWRRRANDLDNALTLADSLRGRARRELVADLCAKTDDLAREVIEALGAAVRSAADRTIALDSD